MTEEQEQPYLIPAFNHGVWTKVPYSTIGVEVEWSNQWKRPYESWYEAGWEPYLHLDQYDDMIVFMRREGDYQFLVYFLDGPDNILVTDLPSFLMLLPQIKQLVDLLKQSEKNCDARCERLRAVRERSKVAG